MLNISLQAKGNPTEKLQKLITGLSANQSVLMGKISKEIAVRLQKNFFQMVVSLFGKMRQIRFTNIIPKQLQMLL